MTQDDQFDPYNVDLSCPDEIAASRTPEAIMAAIRSKIDPRHNVLYADRKDCREAGISSVRPVIKITARSGLSRVETVIDIGDVHSLGLKYGVINRRNKIKL